MDFSEYTRILKDCITHYLVILAVLTPFFLAPEIIYLSSKLSKKGEKKAQEEANLGILGFALVLAIALYNTIPAAIDISNENYVSVHGEYYTSKTKYRVDTYVTTDDGEQLNLRIPAGGRVMQDGYVLWGEHEGTIWYAEKSKYILEYIPDETG